MIHAQLSSPSCSITSVRSMTVPSLFNLHDLFLSPVAVIFAIAFGYSYFAAFYRASAREIKRLGKPPCLVPIRPFHLFSTADSMLRSLLYGHFAESLTGLPTIRSYGEIPRFLAENKYYIDLENRALFLVVTNQRCYNHYSSRNAVSDCALDGLRSGSTS